MKKPRTDATAGVSENITGHPNLHERPDKNNSKELARRDDRAMVHLLNSIKRGSLELFEYVYESLKSLHGPEFEKHFRDELSNKEGGK